MTNKLTLLTLMAMLSLALYQCGVESYEAPTAGGGDPAPPKVEEPANEPAPSAGGGGLVSGVGTWDDWYTNKAVWVGKTSEFDKKEGAVDGKDTLRATANIADDRVRDFYIARLIEGLEAGKTYNITLGYKLDSEKPGEMPNADEDDYLKMQNVKTYNYIQYAVQDGDQTKRRPIAQIEDYPDRPVETTKYVDAATIGDGNFHTLEVEHTVGEGETSATFMMIVRFRAEADFNSNWLYLNDFSVAAAG